MTSNFTPDSRQPKGHPVPYGAPTTSHEDHTGHGEHGGHGGHGGHRWMMVACCIPMVVIVVTLVATGVAGTGAIIYAAVCLGMMALMMRAMPGDHH